MGYALIPPKFINADNPENYHLFDAIINNGSINIAKISKCGKYTKNRTFSNFDQLSISVIWKGENYEYNFYYSEEYDVLYFSNEDTARVVIAFLVGEKACGNCVSTLYA